ncbi:MAG: hypothetical protein MHMPM18_003774, partial [Marteilia pararefringens]
DICAGFVLAGVVRSDLILPIDTSPTSEEISFVDRFQNLMNHDQILILIISAECHNLLGDKLEQFSNMQFPILVTLPSTQGKSDFHFDNILVEADKFINCEDII